MRPIDQDLKAHIDSAAAFTRGMSFKGKYASGFDLVSQIGRLADSEPYTLEEERFLLEVFSGTYRTFKQKQCFYNAQAIALETDLGYEEGFLVKYDLPIPLEHAWNTLPSGKAVDVTIHGAGEKSTCDPKKLLKRAIANQENAYYGIPFPADEIRKSWLRNKASVMLMFDPVIAKRL